MVKCGNCGYEPGLLPAWELVTIKNSGCPGCKAKGLWVPMDDPINSPAHYKFGDYELIDIIRAWSSDCGLTQYQLFLWASMQQYLFRFPKKKGPQDLKKADFYLQRLIKEYDE